MSLPLLGVGGPIAAGVSTTSLVAYWKMEEATSATRVDATGRGNDLTNTNSATSVAGIVTNGTGFLRASSQSLSITDNADVSMGDIDFEITGWVYFDAFAVAGIITKWDNLAANEEYAIYYGATTSRLSFLVCDASSGTHEVAANTFGALSTGTWYFMDVYHDSVNNLIGFSINNGSFDTVAHTTGVRDGTKALRLGVDQGASNFMSGRLDEVGIWKRLLTPAERTALYNGGAGKQYPF